MDPPPPVAQSCPATELSIPADRFALIIGAMKCGTTSLFEYLAQHPAVCPSTPKEPEFFSESTRFRTEVDRYDALWDFDPSRHAYAMEASTGYTKAPIESGCAERIHRFGLRPKLIYLVRDPFVRIESTYNHQLKWYGEPPCESMQDEMLVSVSDYANQLDAFLEWFPREDLLVLDFDDLKQDAEAVVARTLDFLGLEPMPSGASFGAHNQTGAMSTGERWAHGNPVAKWLARQTPRWFNDAAKCALRRVTPKNEKARLSDTDRVAIHERLRPSMLRFGAEYGVDVAKWGFAE